MAKVQGVKEKLHFPLYDAFFVPESGKFQDAMTDPRVIRFFVDIQNKTKLETNLQASGVLPSLNTFEARAMRIIASVPKVAVLASKIVDKADIYCKATGTDKDQKKNELLAEIQAECDRACVAANSLLPELIYNSVTTLLVGEKIMIEAPTFWFPSGAGVSPGSGNINHGEPDPTATFRFAEPVFIEPQQNFRVEMLFPRGVPGHGTPPNPNQLAGLSGPLRIWVALDGYLTRDVQ
jgi:hypothetical protein